MHRKQLTDRIFSHTATPRVLLASFAIAWSTFVTPPALAQYGGDFANAGFHDINSRLYTNDGDWAPGYAKAECGGDYPIMAGISADPGHLWAYSALCVPSEEAGVSVHNDAGRTIAERNDSSTGDWFNATTAGVYREYVVECGPDEAMTGVSQSTTDFYEETYIEPEIFLARCSPMDHRVASDCQAVDFADANGSESEEPQDWAPNYIKGTCGPGRYLKGIAGRHRNDVDWHDGSIGGLLGDSNRVSNPPTTILCCTPAFAGRIPKR